MSLFLNFILLFAPTTLLSYVFLRFYSIFFNFDDMSHFFKGSFTIALVATIVSTIIVAVIAYFITKPFDKVLKRLKMNGEAITELEKKKCLSCYNKLITVMTAMIVLFYFVGQLAIELNSIRMGNHTFIPSRFFLIIGQGTSFGLIVLAIVINGLDFTLVKFREKLELHDLQAYKHRLKTTVSGSIIFALCASVFFFFVNMCCGFLGVINNFYDGKHEASELISLILQKEIVCVFLSSVICSVPFIFILLGLSRRIKQTKNNLHEIASKGNLQRRIDINMLDDFGDLTTEINHLMDKLSSMILFLQGNSSVLLEKANDISTCTSTAYSTIESIDSSFEDINSNCLKQHEVIARTERSINLLTESSENVLQNINAQSSAVQEISSSISQMTANIASVAQTSKKAEEVSQELSSFSTLGNEALVSAVKTMEEIQKASAEVISFARVITDIASRTNLLSMNAAIEAAHAGSFGEGFAVVAGEVRTLAESSSTSAKEIKLKIEKMSQKIDDGVEAMSRVGSSFNSVIEKVNETAELSRVISTMMEEQRVGIEDTLNSASKVVDTVKAVQNLSEQETVGVESVKKDIAAVIDASNNTEKAVKDSFEKSRNLKNEIFKVDSSATSNKDSVVKIQSEISQFHV